MSNVCTICGKPLESAQEIEAGACFDHLHQDSVLTEVDTIEELNFEDDAYYGVADSGRLDDGC